ncbi:MAG TPA: hypothetical protein VGC06_19205 [Actinomycetes bacterium]
MQDTRVASSDKDDPAEVAERGFETLMADKARASAHAVQTRPGPGEG